jgi:hypothetical protein
MAGFCNSMELGILHCTDANTVSSCYYKTSWSWIVLHYADCGNNRDMLNVTIFVRPAGPLRSYSFSSPEAGVKPEASTLLRQGKSMNLV